MKAVGLMVFLFVVACSIGLVGIWQEQKEKEVLQSTIDGLKRRNEAERDSLELILKLKSDSLKIAFETIEEAHIERLKAEALALQARKYYHMIKFITHSDSSREKELKELYKSYKP